MERDELSEARKNSVGLARRDMEAIREGIPGVDRVAPRVEIDTWKVLAPGTTTQAKVHGVADDQVELAHLELAEGRFIDAVDERTHAQVAVVGQGVARDLFGHEPPLGRTFKINDGWFTVVGVLAGGGGSSDFQGVTIGSTRQEIYVPYTTAMRKFDRDPLKAPLDEIVVRLEPGRSAVAAADVLQALLERLHSGVDDYELIVPQALLQQSQRTQRIFNIVMGCIAGISLLVGGIGIMNIMLATVLERTREIGVRRAVGARRRDIRGQFIIEAFSISLIGGVAGVVMGVSIAKGVAAWAGWPTVVTAGSILLSTGVSMAVGLASGIYPAPEGGRPRPDRSPPIRVNPPGEPPGAGVRLFSVKGDGTRQGSRPRGGCGWSKSRHWSSVAGAVTSSPGKRSSGGTSRGSTDWRFTT